MGQVAVRWPRLHQEVFISTSATELKRKEGDVFARTFKHSVILVFLLALLQQYDVDDSRLRIP